MEKIYKASSDIALNIVLPSGKNKHVAFTPLSNGTSEYITGDEAIQSGLERHYLYGRLFRSIGTVAGAAKAASDVASESVESGSVETKETKVLEEVEVSDFAVAKDYLATHFGISRTKINSKNLGSLAEKNGIEFVYPE